MSPVYALLGHPVARSRSPAMHNGWLRAHGLPGVYVALEVDVGRERLGARVIDAIRTLGLAGVNLTTPLKQVALPHLDTVDPEAAAIGAVNTVVARGGALHGLNTDVAGVLAELASVNADTTRPAVVIGAGGAGRAVVAALQRAGCPRVDWLNRNRARVDAAIADLAPLAPATTLRAHPFDALHAVAAGAGVVICAIGHGGVDALDRLGLPPLDAGAAYVDLNYWRPRSHDPLLQAAAHRDAATGDGLTMLAHQGAVAFHAFTGIMPDTQPVLDGWRAGAGAT